MQSIRGNPTLCPYPAAVGLVAKFRSWVIWIENNGVGALLKNDDIVLTCSVYFIKSKRVLVPMDAIRACCHARGCIFPVPRRWVSCVIPDAVGSISLFFNAAQQIQRVFPGAVRFNDRIVRVFGRAVKRAVYILLFFHGPVIN